MPSLLENICIRAWEKLRSFGTQLCKRTTGCGFLSQDLLLLNWFLWQVIRDSVSSGGHQTVVVGGCFSDVVATRLVPVGTKSLSGFHADTVKRG